MKHIHKNDKRGRRPKLLFSLGFILLLFISLPQQFSPPTSDDFGTEDTVEIYSSDGIQPNLTRVGYPIILNNGTNQDIWDKLYGKDADDIRIAYYSSDNEWKLTAFQIDEKAYFRSYRTEMGFSANGLSLSDIDLTNWVRYTDDHRYVGSNIDIADEGYSEPNQWECIQSYWYTRNYEGNTPTAPVQADYQSHIDGWQRQIEHCIDWDDELVFTAENGKLASSYSWWNYAEYQHRLQVTISDPVDGGQSWMYIYYRDDDTNTPRESNYFIPSGASDLVSWDKANMKITGQTYELAIDPSNTDLESSLRIKWPGLTPNDLLDDNNKNWVSAHLSVYYNNIVTLDEEGDADVWREGQFDGISAGYYNEKLSALGYGLTVDLDLPGLTGGPLPGQDTSMTNGHRYTAYDGSAGNHVLQDDGVSIIFIGEVIPPDQDNDGDESETMPYLRGDPDFSAVSGEAAIDGPVRVILDRFQFQVLATSTSKLDYEEIWNFDHQTLKYYGNMKHEDPYTFNLDFSSGDLNVWIDPHFMMFHTQRFSDFVRNDPNSFIMLGTAPGASVEGIIPGFDGAQAQEVRAGSWPFYLYPSGVGTDDDFTASTSSNGPTSGLTKTNSPYQMAAAGLNPGGSTTNPSPNNPLSDWYYLSTSSGGMWQYVPYQEYYAMYTGYNGDNVGDTQGLDSKINRDMATYWRDDSITEFGLYGHHADENPTSDEFELRTVFGNFSYWESQREYARMKYQLNEGVTVVDEVYPGGAIFEDTDIYVNGVLVSSGYPWVENGDVVWIDCDMDDAYDVGDWSIIAGSTTLGYSGFSISVQNAITHVYRVEFTVSDTGNFVPPNAGANIRIQVATFPPAYTDEEFYLDNTNPNQITDLNAVADYATVGLSWSAASDNGGVDYVQVVRNSSVVATLSAGATSWTDNNVVNGKTYTYKIRVFDYIGHSTDSTTDSVVIDLQFDPALPSAIPDYFASSVTIDWSDDPGDLGIIDLYYFSWAEDLNNNGVPDGAWTPLGPYATSTQSFLFNPQVRDATPQNGTYLFRVDSYDSDEDVTINSPILASIYDNEKPIPGVIEDIVDEYYPDVAEILVHWSAEFDGLSGIDHFVLEKDTGTTSAPDGSWESLGSFDPTTHDYYDDDLVDNTWYWYRLTAYDAVGNYDTTPLEKVHYHAPITTSPTLKIGEITTNLDVQGVGSGNTFQIDVQVKNIGTAAGTVNDIELSFTHPVAGDVTYEYTIGSGPSFGSIAAGSEYYYTFTGVYADAAATEGLVTIDAELTWETTHTDYEADTPGEIYIRSFSGLTISDVDSTTPVQTGDSNVINFTITNPMVTSVNLTDYSIVIGDDEGWVEDIDYSIDEVNGPIGLNGYTLVGGASTTITFFISIDSGASEGTKSVDVSVDGYELMTDTDVSASETDATSFLVASPGDMTGPSISPISASPNPTSPSAGVITITATISDASSNVDFAGITIQNSGESDVDYVTMYDDGTHGDGAASDGVYGAFWDPSGFSFGSYYVDFNASDDSANDNWGYVNNGLTIVLQDSTGPSFGVTSATPDPADPDDGDLVTITVAISDATGVGSATATIQDPSHVDIITIDLYDDGTHGDAISGNGIWTGQWDCSGESDGTYYVDLWAEDSSAGTNTNTANDAITFTLEDNTGPTFGTVLVTPDPADPDDGETMLFTVAISDLNGVDSASLTIQDSGENDVITFSLYDDGTHGDVVSGNGVWSGQWNCLDADVGSYYVDVWARDSSAGSNVNTGNNLQTFSLVDATAPQISGSQISPTGGIVGTSFTISTDVEDLSTVDSVYATIELSNVYYDSIQLYDDGLHGDGSASDGTWAGSWDSTGADVDSYTISINATADGYTGYDDDFTILTLTASDDQAPTIQDIEATPDMVNPGTSITISVSISDGSGLLTPNVTIEGVGTFDLIHDSGNLYYYDWDTTGATATLYDITVTAADNSVNHNEDSLIATDLINVTNDDFTAPVTSNPADLSNGEVGDVFNLFIEVTDNSAVDSVIVYIQNNVGTTVETIALTDPNTDDIFTGTWDSTGFSTGNYYTDYFANDTTGNSAYLNNYGGAFVLSDTVAPAIDIVSLSDSTLEYGSVLTITVPVSDPSGISSVYADIQLGNENTILSIQLRDNGISPDAAVDGVYTGVWDSTSDTLSVNYEIDIRATDASTAHNNIESDDAATFSLEDTTLPQLSTISITSGTLEFPTLINIQVDVEDDFGVDSVWATILLGGSDVAYVELSLGSGNTYSGIWNPSGYALGIYSVDLNATDASTNPSANTAYSLGAGSFEMVDTTNPLLGAYNVNPGLIELNDPVALSVEVTDNYGISTVYATITDLDSGVWLASVTLTDGNSDDIFDGIWDSTGFSLGSYYISFNATDLEGHFTEVLDVTTVVISTIPPVLVFDLNDMYSISIGYIGEDQIILNFSVSTDKDINITMIGLEFWEQVSKDSYSEYFSFDSVNITLPYELLAIDPKLFIEIRYNIDSDAPIFGDVEKLQWNITMQVQDEFDEVHSFSKKIAAVNAQPVEIFAIPEISSLEFVVDGIVYESNHYLNEDNLNKIHFYAEGTHYGTTYDAVLDLSAFGLGLRSFLWNSGTQRYEYTINTQLPKGYYDCSLVTANISIEYPGISYLEDIGSYSDDFSIDTDDPVADLDSLAIPNSIDPLGGGFTFTIALADYSDSDPSTISSGIQYAEILININNPLTLELVPVGSGIYGVSVSQNAILSSGIVYGDKISVISLTVIDQTGNQIEVIFSPAPNCGIVDESAPDLSIESLSLQIGNIEKSDNSTTILRANTYIAITLHVNDGGSLSSGLYYVRIYYRITTIGAPSSADDEYLLWDYFELSALGNGTFYGVIPSESVGFSPDQQLEIVIAASDFDNNRGSTGIFTVTFTSDSMTISYVALVGSGLVVSLGLLYRIGNRKNMKYIVR